MKIKKLFGLLIIGSLIFTACDKKSSSEEPAPSSADQTSSQPAPSSSASGGQATSSNQQTTSAADQSSSEQSSSAAEESSEEEESSSNPFPGWTSSEPDPDAPQISVSAMTLVKKTDDKIYIHLEGEEANYEGTSLKWAWGLGLQQNQWGQPSFENGYGKQNPETEDFNVNVPFNAETGAFEVELCISDLTLAEGTYQVYAGTEGHYSRRNFTEGNDSVKDTKFDYSCTASQGGGFGSQSTLKLEEIPDPSAPSLTVSAVKLIEKTDNKVYISIEGTVANYTELKWAWGLAIQQGQWGNNYSFDGGYGKQNPEGDDFNVNVPFDSEGAFVAELCVTDLTLVGGVYRVYGGPQGKYVQRNFTVTNFDLQDTKFVYFCRTDFGESNALGLDALPPFAFTEASIVKYAAGDVPSGFEAGFYLKTGGTTSIDHATIEAWSIKGDFQPQGGGNGSTRTWGDTDFFWTFEGSKAYLNIYVGYMTAGARNMVHFGYDVDTPGKLIMANNINEEFPFNEDGIKFTVYANPSAGQAGGAQEFYGSLGVSASAIE